jgi:type III restriction enzyme
MPETKNLFNVIKEKAYDYGIIKPEILPYITENLKHEFFDWQNEALQNFLTYEAIREREKRADSRRLLKEQSE